MNASNWLAWLRAWLFQHPVKEPPAALGRGYTEEVMRRVRATHTPSPAFQWIPRPRLAFALATAAACLLIVSVVGGREATRVAQHVEEDWQLLAELDEGLDPLEPRPFEEELQAVDQLLLAQAGSEADAEAWIDETLEVLERLDAEDALPASEEGTEEWLEELQQLDEAEFDRTA